MRIIFPKHMSVFIKAANPLVVLCLFGGGLLVQAAQGCL